MYLTAIIFISCAGCGAFGFLAHYFQQKEKRLTFALRQCHYMPRCSLGQKNSAAEKSAAARRNLQICAFYSWFCATIMMFFFGAAVMGAIIKFFG